MEDKDISGDIYLHEYINNEHKNIAFYQIVKTTKNFAFLREIASEVVEYDNVPEEYRSKEKKDFLGREIIYYRPIRDAFLENPVIRRKMRFAQKTSTPYFMFNRCEMIIKVLDDSDNNFFWHKNYYRELINNITKGMTASKQIEYIC